MDENKVCDEKYEFPRPYVQRSMVFYVAVWPLALMFNVYMTIFFKIEGNVMVGKGRISSRYPRLHDKLEFFGIWGCATFTIPESPWNDGPLF